MKEKDELEELLERAEKKKTQKTAADIIPGTITFSEKSYQKAEMIGPIVARLAKRDLEWSGFMLAQRGDPQCIIRDILLQKDQRIEYGGVEISGKAIAKVSSILEERNKKYGTNLYVIGWIHGHGAAYPAPSTTDRENFAIVLNSVGLNTEQRILVPLPLIESDTIKTKSPHRLAYRGKALEDAVIEFAPEDDTKLKHILRSHGINADDDKVRKKTIGLLESLLKGTELRFLEPNIVGFAYFVIVNNKHDDPYAAIAYSEERVITKSHSNKLRENVKVAKVHVQRDITIDKWSLTEEIKESVELPKPKLKRFYISKWFGDVQAEGTTVIPVKTELQSNAQIGQPQVSSATNKTSTSRGGLFISRSFLELLESTISLYRTQQSTERLAEVEEFVSLMKDVDKNYWNREKQIDLIETYFRTRYQSSTETKDDTKTTQDAGIQSPGSETNLPKPTEQP